MKLSDKTLAILKNFASINKGVVLKKGKVQKTICADTKNIFVTATLDDDITEEFGIYDLNQFLGNVTTLKNPEITFTKESVQLNDGEMDFDYRACAPNLIVTPPDKELKLKQVDGKFDLPYSVFTKFMKLAAMNSLPHLSVVGEKGDLKLKIHDKPVSTSNRGFTKIGSHTGEDFIITFKRENLKLLPDDYTVEFMIGGFATFTNQDGTLKYAIGLEV
jgi:hypothetical protein